MSDTRQRILETARGLFNAQGVHRVGVRDIARATELSPGNLSYHFATKDDLVTALVLELHQLNARTVFADVPKEVSLVTLYHLAVGSMLNMLKYRFVLLSYVDAVMASPELRKFEASLAPLRRQRSDALLTLLADGGFVDARAVATRADYLYEQSQLVSSGWLRIASLASPSKSDDAVVLHYAKVGMVLLERFCTPRGARQLRRILAGDYDDAVLMPAPLRGRVRTAAISRGR
jgi:AcrR family transcriptional regulator